MLPQIAFLRLYRPLMQVTVMYGLGRPDATGALGQMETCVLSFPADNRRRPAIDMGRVALFATSDGEDR